MIKISLDQVEETDFVVEVVRTDTHQVLYTRFFNNQDTAKQCSGLLCDLYAAVGIKYSYIESDNEDGCEEIPA